MRKNCIITGQTFSLTDLIAIETSLEEYNVWAFSLMELKRNQLLKLDGQTIIFAGTADELSEFNTTLQNRGLTKNRAYWVPSRAPLGVNENSPAYRLEHNAQNKISVSSDESVELMDVLSISKEHKAELSGVDPGRVVTTDTTIFTTDCTFVTLNLNGKEEAKQSINKKVLFL